MKAKSYAVPAADKPLEYYEFDRREPTSKDVELEVYYCGICHSDIHTARGDWGEVTYPCVPGHEIVGVVTRVGEAVTEFKPGDRVGVGCMVNSCGECSACKQGYENSCFKETVWTYSSTDPIDGTGTKGGYSTIMVAPEHFVLHLPESLDMASAAPLLCAGITTYSPLRNWKVTKGSTVGIIGLGGLGHMGVKYAKAFGAEVWVITSSPDKAEAAKSYGADGVIISSSEKDMESAAHRFDFLLDTIPKTYRHISNSSIYTVRFVWLVPLSLCPVIIRWSLLMGSALSRDLALVALKRRRKCCRIALSIPFCQR